MDHGFNQKEEPIGFEQTMDFCEKCSLIGDLMDHPKRQNEIGSRMITQGIRAREMCGDSFRDPASLSSAGQSREHSGLNVNGGHMPRWAHNLCKGNGEIAHAGTNLYHVVPRSDVRTQDRLGVVEQFAQRVVEGETQPPGTHAFLTCQLIHHSIDDLSAD